MSMKKLTMKDQTAAAIKELQNLYYEVDLSTPEIARKRAGEIVFKEAMVSLMENDVLTEVLNPVIIMSGNILNTYWEKLLEAESSPELVMGVGILDLFGVDDDEESTTETTPEVKDDVDKKTDDTEIKPERTDYSVELEKVACNELKRINAILEGNNKCVWAIEYKEILSILLSDINKINSLETFLIYVPRFTEITAGFHGFESACVTVINHLYRKWLETEEAKKLYDRQLMRDVFRSMLLCASKKEKFIMPDVNELIKEKIAHAKAGFEAELELMSGTDAANRFDEIFFKKSVFEAYDANNDLFASFPEIIGLDDVIDWLWDHWSASDQDKGILKFLSELNASDLTTKSGSDRQLLLNQLVEKLWVEYENDKQPEVERDPDPEIFRTGRLVAPFGEDFFRRNILNSIPSVDWTAEQITTMLGEENLLQTMARFARRNHGFNPEEFSFESFLKTFVTVWKPSVEKKETIKESSESILSNIERKILSEKLETKLWEEYGASLLDTSISPHKMVEILDYIPTPEYTKDDFAILLKTENLLKRIMGFMLSEEAQGKQVNLAAFAKILPVHIKNNSETN